MLAEVDRAHRDQRSAVAGIQFQFGLKFLACLIGLVALPKQTSDFVMEVRQSRTLGKSEPVLLNGPEILVSSRVRVCEQLVGPVRIRRDRIQLQISRQRQLFVTARFPIEKFGSTRLGSRNGIQEGERSLRTAGFIQRPGYGQPLRQRRLRSQDQDATLGGWLELIIAEPAVDSLGATILPWTRISGNGCKLRTKFRTGRRRTAVLGRDKRDRQPGGTPGLLLHSRADLVQLLAQAGRKQLRSRLAKTGFTNSQGLLGSGLVLFQSLCPVGKRSFQVAPQELDLAAPHSGAKAVRVELELGIDLGQSVFQASGAHKDLTDFQVESFPARGLSQGILQMNERFRPVATALVTLRQELFPVGRGGINCTH